MGSCPPSPPVLLQSEGVSPNGQTPLGARLRPAGCCCASFSSAWKEQSQFTSRQPQTQVSWPPGHWALCPRCVAYTHLSGRRPGSCPGVWRTHISLVGISGSCGSSYTSLFREKTSSCPLAAEWGIGSGTRRGSRQKQVQQAWGKRSAAKRPDWAERGCGQASR